MWSDLTPAWQACLELAWEAYCDDCIPIGAVVTDEGGVVLSRGRNRVYPRSMWSMVCGCGKPGRCKNRATMPSLPKRCSTGWYYW
jgi:hypothetical protein